MNNKIGSNDIIKNKSETVCRLPLPHTHTHLDNGLDFELNML